MGKCKHCFQYDCTPTTCTFPSEQHAAMVEASTLFFNTDMYDTCLKTKAETRQAPHTHDNWSDYDQTHEGARGYWHDYGGYDQSNWHVQDREGWVIEPEEQFKGYYTEEWFKAEEQRFKKRKKETPPSSKKLNKAEEASGGESSQEET